MRSELLRKRRYAKWIVMAVLLVLAVLVIYWLFNTRGQTDIVIPDEVEQVEITSQAFADMGVIPIDYTGDGDDISPDLHIAGLSDHAVSIAVIMDDLDVTWSSNYNHWTIWNISPNADIPEAIEHGTEVEALGNAIQGVGFGKNCYRGPNPPFGSHRYQFHVFVLDTEISLSSESGKKELLQAMEGHMLQYGSITGWYPEAR